jgi:transcriptional regulator with XRE-family HTH domain
LAVKKNIYLKRLGLHISKIRTSKGISQLELASIINKDRQSIQRLERGAVNPSVFYLQEVADGLEISLSKLLDFS